ncbi:TorF family putative porin [Hyphomicrobium sp.]|uniref:TorF family putative porin n=1 Tax=Hyphomicrobium sp. TaxID=82 RepID=UPI0025B9E7AD|nr:TorF family putative porin [Hyphomicrobium sp.]MCC7253426.1 hypothetical protein [Hyphomicrobium sp.]
MTPTFAKTLGAASAALLMLAAPASAGGLSLKDDAGRTFEWSVNAAITSDYVFRGVSQSDNDPALQAGIDFTYGILYAGAWGSSVDEDFVFGNLEIDYYAGIKPTLGAATFDFGVLYYTYPGAAEPATGDVEVFELKAGVSGEILPSLSGSQTFYWSPEAQGDAGEYWVSETSLSYTLPKVFVFEPSISGTYGYVENVDTDAEMSYWNAGLTLGYDKFAFDFRYWDSDVDTLTPSGSNLSDERFVFTAKVAFP